MREEELENDKKSLNKRKRTTSYMKRYWFTAAQIFFVFVVVLGGFNIFYHITNKPTNVFFLTMGVFFVLVGLVMLFFPKLLGSLFKL